MDLRKFDGRQGTINIIERIGSDYPSLGTFLLGDRDGGKVRAIEVAQHHDPTVITPEILRRWLTGEGANPVSWNTLIEALRDARLNTLAQDIEEAFQT